MFLDKMENGGPDISLIEFHRVTDNSDCKIKVGDVVQVHEESERVKH